MFRSLCFISCAVTCSKLFFSVEAASLLGDVCDVVDEVVFLWEVTLRFVFAFSFGIKEIKVVVLCFSVVCGAAACACSFWFSVPAGDLCK